MPVSVLCLLLFNIITLSACENVTFYIKPTLEFGDCSSSYQPCLTLDEFASNELPNANGNFSNVSLTLMFLPGNHLSCEEVVFTDIDSVAMIGMNSNFDLENPQVVIDLLCYNINVTGIYSGFSLSYLEINGMGDNSVVIRDGVSEVSIFQVKLVTSALLIRSGYDIEVYIHQVFFKASKINVNSTFVANISITNSTFLSGDQLQTMAICHKELNHSEPNFLQLLLVNVDSVTVSDLSQSDADLKPPSDHSGFCDSYDSQLDTSSDFHLLLQHSDVKLQHLHVTIVTLSIKNSNFIHDQKSSTAIILELVQSSMIAIHNTVISGYTQGAIILLNLWAPVVFELTNSTIKENSLSHPVLEDLEMNAGAALTIYNYIHELPIPMFYQVSKCVFRHNSDNQENSEIILIYGLHSMYVEDSVFANNHGTPISAHDSKFSLEGVVKFENNSAKRGGALALYTAELKLSVVVEAHFCNNSASEFGGAIYIKNPSFDFITNINRPCFYHLSLLDFDPSDFSLSFVNNTAVKGGDNIYGAQLKGKCMVNALDYNVRSIFTFVPNNTLSPVSSMATRVCLCDSGGNPQCANVSKIFVTDFTVYPGENFLISTVTVGAEFGTTTGIVYAKLQQSSSGSVTGRLGPNQAYQQVRTKDNCTTLRYSVHSLSKHETMYLVSSDTTNRQEYEDYYNSVETAIEEYTNDNIVSAVLLTVPVFINITFKDCPPGFEMTDDKMSCDCYAELHGYNISCMFQDGIGHITRNGNNWVGVSKDETDILFNDNCLLEYCKQEVVTVKIEGPGAMNESDSQCAFHHAGRLCGGCKEGYSLSLGSSHCLYCSESSIYTALVAFLFGGLILVGIILLLDLTIGNGGMNGLIFYANIVWAYRSLIFPHSDANINNGLLKVIKYFFKIFIATLNLDVGLEICFWDGMDAFWKSILQFAFPVYIWIITGVAIAVMKYLPCCVRCIQGCAKCKCTQRPVEVLVTLILMSYAKLIRTILGVFTFSIVKIYSGSTTDSIVVWSLDGNVSYLSGKHVVLFIIALFALFLALIYTIYISLVGLKDLFWADKNNNQILNKCTKILNMPLPLYDAHFASFKKNHKYWLGLLLFVRAVLLLIFSSTLGISPVVNLPILILVITLLLFWMGWKQIYEKKLAWFLQALSLSNLIAISGGILYAELANKELWKSILVCISVGIAFLQFAGIVGQSIVQYCRKCANRSDNTTITDNLMDEYTNVHGANELREPLLDDYSDND